MITQTTTTKRFEPPPDQATAPVVNLLPELIRRTFGRIVMVYDGKVHYLLGRFDPDHLRYFRPRSDHPTDILPAVRDVSDFFYREGRERYQEMGIRVPEGVDGRVVGGSLAYYDGDGSLYFDGQSHLFGRLTQRGLRSGLEGLGKKLHFGNEILTTDEISAALTHHHEAWAMADDLEKRGL